MSRVQLTQGRLKYPCLSVLFVCLLPFPSPFICVSYVRAYGGKKKSDSVFHFSAPPPPLEIGSFYIAPAALEPIIYIVQAGLALTERCACLCFSSARTKGLHHHAWLPLYRSEPGFLSVPGVH